MRETFARALREFLGIGFAVDQAISVGFIVSVWFDDGPATIVFPKEGGETYLPAYALEDYVPPSARTPD